MTHEEVQEMLAAYALRALEPSEEAAVDEHLTSCESCQAEYLSLQLTVDRLAEAPLQPPVPGRLRSRLLTNAQELVTDTNQGPREDNILPFREPRAAQPSTPLQSNRWPRSSRLPRLAAAVLVGALSYTTLNGVGTNRQNRAELSRDSAALALLTSTETTNNLLAPAPGSNPPEQAHGHWFHRAGVLTQVCVAEFLSQPPPGRFYEVWLLEANMWTPAGRMDVDTSGYGRVIVLGSDGSGVSSVEVTLEQGQPSQPGANVVLRYP